MPDPCSYDYAVVRVVPRVDRGEFVNAGVVLHCSEQGFLNSLVHVDEQRLRALWTGVDVELVKQHLDAFPRVCAGQEEAGPIGKLSKRERFHWLVAPRNTIIQVSPVHSGMTSTPEATLHELFHRLVISLR